MVAIESLRLCPVETAELLKLGRHDVFEGANEPRVKDRPSKGVPQQVRGKFTLMFHEPCGTLQCRKRRRKVEVEASVDSRFPCHRRGTL
jgi:hypothetical protein